MTLCSETVVEPWDSTAGIEREILYVVGRRKSFRLTSLVLLLHEEFPAAPERALTNAIVGLWNRGLLRFYTGASTHPEPALLSELSAKARQLRPDWQCSLVKN